MQSKLLFISAMALSLAMSSCSKMDDVSPKEEPLQVQAPEETLLDGYFTMRPEGQCYVRRTDETMIRTLSFTGTIFYPDGNAYATTSVWNYPPYTILHNLNYSTGKTVVSNQFRITSILPIEGELTKPLVYYGLNGYVSNTTATTYTGANLWKPTAEFTSRGVKNIFFNMNNGAGLMSTRYMINVIDSRSNTYLVNSKSPYAGIATTSGEQYNIRIQSDAIGTTYPFLIVTVRKGGTIIENRVLDGTLTTIDYIIPLAITTDPDWDYEVLITPSNTK